MRDVDGVFDPGENTDPARLDCVGGTMIVASRGLITSIRPGEFAAIWGTVGNFGGMAGTIARPQCPSFGERIRRSAARRSAT